MSDLFDEDLFFFPLSHYQLFKFQKLLILFLDHHSMYHLMYHFIYHLIYHLIFHLMYHLYHLIFHLIYQLQLIFHNIPLKLFNFLSKEEYQDKKYSLSLGK